MFKLNINNGLYQVIKTKMVFIKDCDAISENTFNNWYNNGAGYKEAMDHARSDYHDCMNSAGGSSSAGSWTAVKQKLDLKKP